MQSVKAKKVKRCRLIDVATAAGVSRATAAKVLLGTGGDHIRVGQDTFARVAKIGKEMGYRANMAAQMLKGKRTNTIGVIIDSYAAELAFRNLAEIEQEAARLGWRLIIGQSHNDSDGTLKYCDDFASRGVDGVICLSHRYPDSGERIANAFREKHEHVVFVGKPYGSNGNCNYVDVELTHGMRLAVNHLVETGRKRIGMIKFGAEYPAIQAMRDEFLAALESHGIDTDPQWVQMLDSQGPEVDMKEVLFEATRKLVVDGKVDAIVASNDTCAAIVIKKLKRLGYSVPHDLAIIGEDNLPLCELLDPELTTIDHRNSIISKTVVQILVDMMMGKKLTVEERQVTLKPQLIIRESTSV